ncbi:hypothetical protein [Desulfoscipio geothermicus]|uniref:His-Xaa-Ser system protein HxsD n=1 Tax=Desulfoscipio geothermicus DSM 3669 TaxID=1121426 RepID=A0A1I6E8X1_9FIRM|nr:hypothetical protein [Desulfoscipio geothermicus]SFR14011.1 hypothetical protein SAMN05660706_12949 [Desulfoscipio geothermicus DSM 3669]
MSQAISVELTIQGENDVLLFKTDPDIAVNLNSESGQQDLKRVFSKLLEKSIIDDIVLELSISSNYTKSLYKEVCQEYIEALNTEIKKVSVEIRKSIK